MRNNEFHLLHLRTRHQCDHPSTHCHPIIVDILKVLLLVTLMAADVLHITKWSVGLHDPLFLDILPIIFSPQRYSIFFIIPTWYHECSCKYTFPKLYQQRDRSSSPGLSLEFVVMAS